MRPSWPPPRMPMVAPGVERRSAGQSFGRLRRRPRSARARQASSRLASAVSDSASTAAASSAALIAPGLPMASVPTGMPAGICTIEEKAVLALERVRIHRHAEHRQRRHRRRHAGQMRGAAGAGDDDLEAASRARFGESIEPVRRAMGGHDQRLVADAERIQRLGGVLHRRPVGLAAHDDRDRFCRHSRFPGPCAKPGERKRWIIG